MTARTHDRAPEPWDPAPRVVPRTPFERSARFWLNAYPRRWRDVHGEELLGVLEEVYGAGDDALPPRLPCVEVRGLLRAGWSLRWREHPPVGPWLLYRVYGRRLDGRHWRWVVDDIRGRWFPAVNTISRVSPFLVLWGLQGLTMPGSLFARPWVWAAYLSLLGTLVLIPAARRSARRGEWKRHVIRGNVPHSLRRGHADGVDLVPLGTRSSVAGTMAPGVDPAITGESPEERPSRAS